MNSEVGAGKTAFHHALAFASNCFEYILIFSPFFLMSLSGRGGIIVALLSVFVFSLSSLVSLFDGGKAKRVSSIARYFRVLVNVSVVCTTLSLIVSFGAIVSIGSVIEVIDEIPIALEATLVVLGFLLVPGAVINLLLLIYSLGSASSASRNANSRPSTGAEVSGRIGVVKRDIGRTAICGLTSSCRYRVS